MELLDDLSGFQFEDLMEDVFRKLGYENVRQAVKTADEGRDILMEEVVDGRRRAVIVECKHTDSVGRPVVQKLHSAIATFEFDGPKRGMVVTTGRLTAPAREYANRLRNNGDPYPIELIDGTDLRELSEDIGLDLYNGRIEVLCDETLRPVDPTAGRDGPVLEAFRPIENIDSRRVLAPWTSVSFDPVLSITARTDATFETSVGVVHQVDQQNTFLIHADRQHPRVADGDVGTLVQENFSRTIELDEVAMEQLFDDVSVNRFGQTETEYKEWAIDQLRERHTTTVEYTGDNNVSYTKTCTPKLSDVSVQSIEPVYVPEIRSRTELGEYTYPLEYYAAGPSRVTVEDGIHRCVHCDSVQDGTYTFCENCGSINCQKHIKVERLEDEPVCTDCAVTERFFLRMKYFYDEQNLDEFREEYAAMPVHEKAMENPPLVGGSLVGTVAIILLLAIQFGLI
jgi:restriction endonuclease Mrr